MTEHSQPSRGTWWPHGQVFRAGPEGRAPVPPAPKPGAASRFVPRAVWAGGRVQGECPQSHGDVGGRTLRPRRGEGCRELGPWPEASAFVILSSLSGTRRPKLGSGKARVRNNET